MSSAYVLKSDMESSFPVDAVVVVVVVVVGGVHGSGSAF